MKKVLFVCHGYYPEPSPTGLCVKKVIKRCLERGYDVACLTGSRYQAAPYEVVDGVPVYRVKYPLYMRLFHAWRKMNPLIGWPVRFFTGIYARIHNIFFTFFWPFRYYSLYRRYCSKIKELCERFHFDLIVGVHNPIEALVALNNYKKRDKNIPVVYYYIDALSGGNDVKANERKSRFFPWKHFFFNAAKSWELSLSRSAERIIVMEAARNHYYENYTDTRFLSKLTFLSVPLLNDPSVNPGSGFDGLDEMIPKEKNMILFCGRIYSLRDPAYIIEIIKKIDLNDFVWVFIGTCVRCYKSLLINAQKQYPDRIILLDQIPHERLSVFLNRADFFLNIGESVPSVVSGKIFEYISYGKPIISTSPIPDNSSIQTLAKYKQSLILYDKDDINYSITRLKSFLMSSPHAKIAFSEIKRSFYNSTPDAFVDVVDEVLKSRCR